MFINFDCKKDKYFNARQSMALTMTDIMKSMGTVPITERTTQKRSNEKKGTEFDRRIWWNREVEVRKSRRETKTNLSKRRKKSGGWLRSLLGVGIVAGRESLHSIPRTGDVQQGKRDSAQEEEKPETISFLFSYWVSMRSWSFSLSVTHQFSLNMSGIDCFQNPSKKSLQKAKRENW